MNSGSRTIIGIDVGGTKIHGGIYEVRNDGQFLLLQDALVPTKAKEGIGTVLEQVVEMIGSLRREDTLSVGVGLPGQVNHEQGILYRTANITYERPVDLKAFFASRVDLPMTFDNDAKLFTLAEFTLNQQPKGVRNMLGITLGTGLGGGIIINGELYRGTHGFAGELGHMYFDKTRDCEEVIASKGEDTTRGMYLGMLIRALINVFDPQVIALGGAISKRFEEFQGAMWEEIRKHKVEEAWKELVIYPTQIQHPGTLGAALMNLQFTI